MYQIDFNHPISVYFCGIGGISMSGLAEILASRGFRVSGSDRASSAITEELASHGIQVLIGQKAENITPDLDLIVFTAAISSIPFKLCYMYFITCIICSQDKLNYKIVQNAKCILHSTK